MIENEPLPLMRQKPRRRRWVRISAIITAGLLVIILAGLWLVWQSTTAENAASNAALTQRIAALEASLAELRAVPAASLPAAINPTALNELQQTIKTLTTRIEALEVAPLPPSSPWPGAAGGAPPVSDSALASLRARIDELSRNAPDARTVTDLVERVGKLSDAEHALETRLAQSEHTLAAGQNLATHHAAFALGLGQLSAALASGAPYTAPLHTLDEYTQNDPGLTVILDPLRPRAETGVPTAPELERRFLKLAHNVKIAAIAGTGGDWSDRLRQFFAGLITIKNTSGGSPEIGIDGIIAHTEARLAALDVAGALQTLQNAPPASQAVLGEWSKDATARVNADQALAELSHRTLATLGADHG